MIGVEHIFCWSSDEFVRAVQLALAERGMNVTPLPNDGSVLVVSRDYIGNYRHVLYRDDNMYYISHFRRDHSIMYIAAFDIADPECLIAIYDKIMELTDNNPFP